MLKLKLKKPPTEKPKPKTQAAANEDLEGIMVVIPGGLLAVNALFEHEELGDLLKEHNEKGGYIAAICAGPVVLGELGLLEGRSANCHRGFEGELYGATIVNERVVVDKNIITSIGPGSSIEFSLALVEIIKGAKTAEIVANGMMMK